MDQNGGPQGAGPPETTQRCGCHYTPRRAAISSANLLNWLATIEFIPGQPNELAVAGVGRPVSVTAGSSQFKFDPNRKPFATNPGWRYDKRLGAVIVRFMQNQRREKVRIVW